MSPALAPAVLHSEPVALVSVWTVLVLRFCDVSADIVLALELFRISLPVCVAKAMEAISFRVYCLHGQCFHCCFYSLIVHVDQLMMYTVGEHYSASAAPGY